MAFYDKFPYTNFQELNLDYLIRKLVEQDKKIADFINLSTIKYADPIQWNITTQYEANTVVVDPETGTAYISSQPVPAGVSLSNTDYWSVIFDLSDVVDMLADKVSEAIDEMQATVDEIKAEMGQERQVAFLRNDSEYCLGDCIVLYGGPKTAVIDFGREADAVTLRSFLKAHNLSKIDYIIFTHYHADHIGGGGANGFLSFLGDSYFDFSETVAYLPHGLLDWSRIVGTGWDTTTQAYQTTIESALTGAGIRIVKPSEGDVVQVSETETFRFNNLSAAYFNQYYTNTLDAYENAQTYTNYNNFSMLVTYRFLDQTVLFTGDIERLGQSFNYQQIEDINVYSVEHHGLNVNTDQHWLQQLQGKFAIVGVNSNAAVPATSYSRTTVQNLLDKGVKVISTKEAPTNIIITLKRGDAFANVAYYGEMNNPALTAWQGQELSPGADLNDITNPGIWFSNSSAKTGALVNAPTINGGQIVYSGFKMLVLRTNATDPDARIQIIIPFNTNFTTIFIRATVSGAWGRWKAIQPTTYIFDNTNDRFNQHVTAVAAMTITAGRLTKKSGWVDFFARFTPTSNVAYSGVLFEIPWNIWRQGYQVYDYAHRYQTSAPSLISVQADDNDNPTKTQIICREAIPAGTEMILHFVTAAAPEDERVNP